MRTIALPKHKPLTASLEQCLQNRRSCREMSEKELSDEDLSSLLWSCVGITSAEDGRRTTPSTLDLKGVSVCVVRRDGAWRYDAEHNQLTELTDADVRELTTTYQFEFVKEAPVTLVFVADHERTKKARPTGVFCDAGTMGQSCYLAAVSLGIKGCIRASFDHDKLAQAMKLQPFEEPIMLFTCGYGR